MHASMYRHPIVVENIEKLRSIGVEVLMPRLEEEKAKIPSTEEIVSSVVSRLSENKNLKGLRVLVTSGPTREYIDGFRYITNPSSGKMGVALAEAALRRGAEVTLIHGHMAVAPPTGARAVGVGTTEEMLEAVVDALKDGRQDVAILSAAACDYGPLERKMIKTPSGIEHWQIELRPLPKIIERVKKVDKEIFLVGFKAEYNVSDRELIERATRRLEEVDMDLIVANDVAREKAGFCSDTNEVFIIDKEGGVTHMPLTGKDKIADRLLTMVRDKLGT